MTVTYTGNLKLGLPVSGTEIGTWGDIVNQQITNPLDQAVSGTVALTSMVNADYTLANGNGAATNEARYMALLIPATLTLTAARNVIVPSTSKMYLVTNSSVGGYAVTVKTAAGTGVAVASGTRALLYCDGTNVEAILSTANFVTLTGTETVTNKTLTTISLRETKAVIGASNIDMAVGNCFTRSITANTTFTVSNVPAAGTVGSFILDLTNGGAFTITWWANMKWAGGLAPTLTASGRDVLGFFTHDAGATWNGLVLGKAMA